MVTKQFRFSLKLRYLPSNHCIFCKHRMDGINICIREINSRDQRSRSPWVVARCIQSIAGAVVATAECTQKVGRSRSPLVAASTEWTENRGIKFTWSDILSRIILHNVLGHFFKVFGSTCSLWTTQNHNREFYDFILEWIVERGVYQKLKPTFSFTIKDHLHLYIPVRHFPELSSSRRPQPGPMPSHAASRRTTRVR